MPRSRSVADSPSDAVAMRAEKPSDNNTMMVTAAVTSGKRHTKKTIVAAEVTRMAINKTMFARP